MNSSTVPTPRRRRFLASAGALLVIVGAAALVTAGSTSPASGRVNAVRADAPHVVGAAKPFGSALGRPVGHLPVDLAHVPATMRLATAGRASNDLEATTQSTNWSGLVTQAANTYQGAYGTWTQPSITASSDDRHSSTWVGVDDTNQKLIQTGTEADSVKGVVRYSAWFEMLPAVETPITYTNGALVPVRPGDSMISEVVHSGNPNIWTIYLRDTTQNWQFDHTFTYVTPGSTAEWVEEATMYNGVISTMPHFSPVTFNNLMVAEAGQWYYTAMNANNRWDIAQRGTGSRRPPLRRPPRRSGSRPPGSDPIAQRPRSMTERGRCARRKYAVAIASVRVIGSGTCAVVGRGV